MKAVSIPTNDPSLPSFERPEYVAVKDDLKLVKDLWDSLKNVKPEYLPKEEKERPKSYQNRLNRTQFDNRFKPALKGYAGLLSDFVLDDPVPSLEESEDNIDLQGTHLTTFLSDLDEMVLRDGGAGLLVEFPSLPEGIESAADLAALDLRPYLVICDRRNIPNWSIEYVQGKPVLQHVTIVENRLMPVGEFGVQQQTFYRVLRPGSFEVWRIVQQRDGSMGKELVQPPTPTGLNEIPFIWYSVSESKWFESEPPFLGLAKLNVEHFQKRSSLNEVLHKCNLPVPVRKGAQPIPGARVPGSAPIYPDLTIGPNSVVDVPETGDFFFREPSGSAIAATQADIEKLEASMDRVSLAFLTGGEAEKTATEVVMDTSQTQCSLKSLARRKESLVQTAFDYWAQYTGEVNEDGNGGEIELNENLLQLPPNPQEVQVILDAMGTKISNETGLKMLKDLGWLPRDTDIDEEVAMLEGMQPPDTEDMPIENEIAPSPDQPDEMMSDAA